MFASQEFVGDCQGFGDRHVHIKISVSAEAPDECHVRLVGGECLVLGELLLVMREPDRVVRLVGPARTRGCTL